MEVNKREPHDEFGNRGIGSTTVEIDFQHTEGERIRPLSRHAVGTTPG